MKTIAILTDFSERAENAANYALYLAQSLRANLILYDAFLVPSASPLAAQVAWPMEDYGELHAESEQELKAFAAKLRSKLTLYDDKTFKPDISCQCHNGNLSVDMGELLANKDLILLVMANHEKSIASLLLGNHVHDLLDTTTLPLLIVRDHYAFQKLDNIAFATDLDATDIEVVRSLVSLAKPTMAKITLIHIGQANTDENAVTKFMTEVSGKIDYPNIRYRKMTSSYIMDEVTGLDENNTYDMLVIVHRHKGFWEALFNQSDTQKMASQIILPLLVYPYPAASLPVF